MNGDYIYLCSVVGQQYVQYCIERMRFRKIDVESLAEEENEDTFLIFVPKQLYDQAWATLQRLNYDLATDSDRHDVFYIDQDRLGMPFLLTEDIANIKRMQNTSDKRFLGFDYEFLSNLQNENESAHGKKVVIVSKYLIGIAIFILPGLVLLGAFVAEIISSYRFNLDLGTVFLLAVGIFMIVVGYKIIARPKKR